MMAAAYAYAKQNSRECIVYLPETRASIHSRYAYVSTVFSKFPTTDAAIDTRIARDGAYSPLEDVSDNHVHIQGYFHNLLYFDTYRSEFTDALDMPTLPAEENTYFVHVRRGDFLLKYAADPMNLY